MLLPVGRGSGPKLLNFLLFHLGWLAAVEGAARGSLWAGPAAFALACGVHLGWLVPRGERAAELRYLLGVGALGLVLDSLVHTLGWILYPTSAWSLPTVPPWILSLWIGFATLPRLSLGWLRGRPLLAALFGAIGGPLSFHFGTRLGAIAAGEPAWRTYAFLALEYGTLMPLMLAAAPRPGEAPVSAPEPGPEPGPGGAAARPGSAGPSLG